MSESPTPTTREQALKSVADEIGRKGIAWAAQEILLLRRRLAATEGARELSGASRP